MYYDFSWQSVGTEKISRERVNFFKVNFGKVPGGAPPWDHHHQKEEGLLYKGKCLAAKVYYFWTLPSGLKTSDFCDMVSWSYTWTLEQSIIAWYVDFPFWPTRRTLKTLSFWRLRRTLGTRELRRPLGGRGGRGRVRPVRWPRGRGLRKRKEAHPCRRRTQAKVCREFLGPRREANRHSNKRSNLRLSPSPCRIAIPWHPLSHSSWQE